MSDIRIRVDSDTKPFKQGIELGVIPPLEDADKALTELGRNQGPEQLERGMRDAQQETKELKRETQRTADAIEQEYRRAYAKAKSEAGDGLDSMRAQSAEVGQEIRQNLGEGIANAARGDFEGLADVVGDTLGGAVAGIGGIATAGAAAAGAAGIGALVAAFQLADAERKKLEESANDLAQAYIDAGSTVLDVVTLTARVSNVLTDPEQKKEAQSLVDLLGVDLPEAARIIAGDTNALTSAYALLTQQQKDVTATKEAGQAANAQEVIDWQASQQAIDTARDALDKWANRNSEAASTATTVSDALKGMLRDAGSATEQVDELGNRLYTLPDGKEILIDANTGQASTNIERFKSDLGGNIPTVKTVDLEVSTSAAEDALRRFTSGGRRLTVVADVVDKKGRLLQ